MEHGTFDIDVAAQISTAALPLGITPLVRVPGREHHHAARVLDNGAQGVIVPHVETAEEARVAVSHCRYSPLGKRSVSGTQPQFGFRSLSLSESTRLANDETLLVVMLESSLGVENAEAIAAVPGVDVLMIGASDLSVDLGIPGELTHPRIEEAFRRVIAACGKHGIHPGMGGIHDSSQIASFVRLGMRFVLGGSDLRFMMAAAQERARFLRNL